MGYLRTAGKKSLGLHVFTILGGFGSELKIGIDIDVVGVSGFRIGNWKNVWVGCIYEVVKNRDVRGIIYESEVFVNGLKQDFAHAVLGIFQGGFKIGIDVDVFEVFTCLGGGRKMCGVSVFTRG